MGAYQDRAEIIELIERVRENDQDAFEQMLEKYKPLLDAAIGKFSKDELSRAHMEDLRQEAILVFYNAILNYDLADDGVEFGLYAKICVTNALLSQIKRLNRLKSIQISNLIDEETVISDEEPSARIIEKESLQRIDRVIKENLSSFEYRVWCLYVSGKTAKEVGKVLGKNERSAANAIYRIRKKLRALLR